MSMEKLYFFTVQFLPSMLPVNNAYVHRIIDLVADTENDSIAQAETADISSVSLVTLSA